MVRKVLKPFTTPSYLLLAICGDSIQYLSFRCFQQLRFIVPRSVLELISILLTMVVLHVVVLSSVFLYAYVWKYDRVVHRPDNMKPTRRSYLVMSIVAFCRMVAGFVHAFIDN